MSEEKEKHFLFVWREAFMSKLGPESPTTRHVLHALAAHMDLKGGSCFPSIARIANETAYSDRCIKKHIKIAGKLGWIKKQTRKLPGKGWKRNSYHAEIPMKIFKEVNKVHHVSKGGESGAEGGERRSKGGEYECKNMVHEVPPSTSYNSKKNSSCEKTAQNHGEVLDDFSEHYIPTKEEYEALRKRIKFGNGCHAEKNYA